jgi:ABC-type nitrate/sulfonate/bicarbonate transport system ATPase subunit
VQEATTGPQAKESLPHEGEWLLRLKGIGYRYPRGVQALSGLDLSVAPGTVAAIVGPSGCGKSTLLAVIAGLSQPGSGQIAWNPDHLSDVDGVHRRKLTIVFQKSTVLPWLTVEKNVAFGLRYLRIDRKVAKARVERLIRMGGLWEFREAYPHQLSGGMRRRVAFLTGVAPFPKVLLLDEPFSALDEPTRLKIHGDVLKIVRELEMTVILVTHDLGEAISIGDEVHVLAARPSHVASRHAVPFGGERDVFELRETAEYHDLYRLIWHDLRAQIEAPQATAQGDSGLPAPTGPDSAWR